MTLGVNITPHLAPAFQSSPAFNLKQTCKQFKHKSAACEALTERIVSPPKQPVANPSRSRLIENSVPLQQIGEWLSSPTRHIHAHPVHFSSTDAQSILDPEELLHYLSSRSNSSIASFRSHPSSALVANVNTSPPSLYDYSEATPTETSVSTGLASRFSGVPLLEEVNGVLERRPNQGRTPRFECSFWFLSCSYISLDQEEWKTHCLSHFRGEEPPKSVQCPLCEEFNYKGDNGWTSWNYRQEHVATHHLLGQTLRTSRPDFHLFQHLWQKRLIDDQDLKELKDDNHNLTRPPSNFTVANGRRGRDRRPQRHQHIGVRRTRHNVRQQDTMANHNAVSTTQGREQPILENAASIRAVNAPTHRPETFANTVDPGHSTAEELESAIQIRRTLPRQEERHHTSRMDQEDAPHPSREETQSHNILPSTSVTLGRGINDIADVHLHPKTMSENDQGSYESDPESPPCDSDLLEEIESSERTLEEHLPGIISDTLKEEYFALLLHSFNMTQQLAPTDVASDQDRPQGSSSASKGKHGAASPPTTDSSQHWSSKRSRRRSPDKGNQDDQEEEGSRRNAPGGTPPNQEDNGPAKDLLFACPFVKRYPHRYLKCFSHSLKDISRVKQHLFRDKTHRLPIYCPNCSRTFEREDLRDEHIRDAQCARRPLVKWEGITESQRRQLSKRSPSTKSPEENWYGVFRILFPSEPLPSSPYIDMDLSGELRAFREHLLIEGPRIWNDFLTSQLPEHLRPYLEELQLLHDSFYAESIVRLCESWYSQCSPSSSVDTRRTREYETIPDAARVSLSSSVAVPYLRSGSRIQFTDAHSEYHPPYAPHRGQPVFAPSSSMLQQNHLLPDYHSVLNIQSTSGIPTVTDPSRSLEASLYPEDIANSISQSHLGAPHIQRRALETAVQDTCIDSSKFGDTSDGLNATFQSAYPSQGEPSSLSSPLAQNQSNSQDIFRLLDIDGF